MDNSLQFNEVTILPAHTTPNKNGIVYSEEAIDSIYDTLCEWEDNNRGLVFNGTDDDLNRACHVLYSCNKKPDGEIVGVIKRLDTPMGLLIADSPEEYVVRPMGMGKIINNEIVDYSLTGLSLTPKHTDSFENRIKYHE